MLKNIYCFKMAANILISISQKWSRDQTLKTHLYKIIFQRNFAKSRRKWIDLHYWIKIFKELFRFKMSAKTIFVILNNNANLC